MSRGEATGRRVVVTGSRGRLGRALMATSPGSVLAWDRPELDLDEPDTIRELAERDRPSLVIHTAAMTRVDHAAQAPDAAMRRNADAVAALARACRDIDAELVLISTNEVFDGRRSDGRGYSEDDEPEPRNAYGRSKLAGELAARRAFDGHAGLWIVRTAWLYGPPGGDFPDKIVAAADRLPPGEALPVVADEFGSPTCSEELAMAIQALLRVTTGGLFHLVAAGVASRFDWARRVLARRRPGRPLKAISIEAFARASNPPPWGVLDTSRAAGLGVAMRPWEAALADYLARS